MVLKIRRLTVKFSTNLTIEMISKYLTLLTHFAATQYTQGFKLEPEAEIDIDVWRRTNRYPLLKHNELAIVLCKYICLTQ